MKKPIAAWNLIRFWTKPWLPRQSTVSNAASLAGRAGGDDPPPSTLFLPSAFSSPRKNQGFKIRIAKRASVLQDALALLNGRYRERGYGFQALTLSKERMTLVAYQGTHAIGTLTVQLETGRGLLSDQCFGEELDGLRTKGARLCEFIKLATAPDAPMPATLASMFHVAFIYAHQVNLASHVAIEVNPRHAAFYTRILGFSPVSPERPNPRVNAPGVLMVCDFKDIEKRLSARGAPAHTGDREPPSFFSHSFSSTVEEGIRRRLQSELAAGRPEAAA